MLSRTLTSTCCTAHRRLGGQPRARARLVEGGDQRLLLQQVAVAPVPRIRLQVLAHLEDPEVLHPLAVLERQNVPTEKAPHPRCLLVSVPFNAAPPRCQLAAARLTAARPPGRRPQGRPPAPSLPVVVSPDVHPAPIRSDRR